MTPKSRISGTSYGALMLPCVVVLAVTTGYPLLSGVYLSFFDWNWGQRFNFVGFENYIELFSSGNFSLIFGNTFHFAFFACLIEIMLGVYLAAQVDKLKQNALTTSLVRTFLLVPLIVSGIIVALMSKIMLDDFIGIVNYLLMEAGFEGSAFFGSDESAMATVIGVDVWWQTAFVYIIFLAGLQGIGKDVIESARLEGANEFQIFWLIKFPLLKPLFLTVFIIRFIDTLKVFDIIFGTTGGGPNQATESIQTFAYRTAFSFLKISESMSVMVVASAITLVICGIYFKISSNGAK